MLKICRSRKQLTRDQVPAKAFTEAVGSHGCCLEETHTTAHQCHCGVQW